MKKSILFIGIALLSMSFIGCTDDILSKIPDPVFKEYCRENFDIDKDGNLSRMEATRVTEIICNGKDFPNLSQIKSLKGLEYFINLERLICSDAQLTSLDVSNKPKLTLLACDHNQLTSLDESKNPKLKWLACDHNQITSLDVSRSPNLERFSCDYNRLTSLDISKHTHLKALACDHNQITSLDVSKNPSLMFLGYDQNSTRLQD